MRKFLALRLRILENDMTQKEVAEEAGLAPSTMSHRMTGSQPFTTKEIKSIGKVLHIPAEDYYKYFFGNVG